MNEDGHQKLAMEAGPVYTGTILIPKSEADRLRGMINPENQESMSEHMENIGHIQGHPIWFMRHALPDGRYVVIGVLASHFQSRFDALLYNPKGDIIDDNFEPSDRIPEVLEFRDGHERIRIEIKESPE